MLEGLKKHATRHGSEFVMETGAEAGLSFSELVALQKHIDTLPRAAKSRYTAETRVKRLLGIEDPEEATS